MSDNLQTNMVGAIVSALISLIVLEPGMSMVMYFFILFAFFKIGGALGEIALAYINE